MSHHRLILPAAMCISGAALITAIVCRVNTAPSATAIGVVIGILASIPTALLLVALLRSRRQS